MSIARNENESFEDFKARREIDNYETKRALKPKMFWDSYIKGTYTNPEKQEHKLYNTKHGRKQLSKGVK